MPGGLSCLLHGAITKFSLNLIAMLVGSNVTYMTARYEWMGRIIDGKGGIDASDGLDARDWSVDGWMGCVC